MMVGCRCLFSGRWRLVGAGGSLAGTCGDLVARVEPSVPGE